MTILVPLTEVEVAVALGYASGGVIYIDMERTFLKMKMGEHEGSVQPVDSPNGQFRALCSCGWTSNAKSEYGDASIALQDHVERYRLRGDSGGKAL